ncbi:hypothetical protein PAHAL_2G189600 [Panicum hallii]|jgi:hypothetical protein|uniref:Uncharacterized protein n=1 Tax=Panicum hallii TaxID=206008 RepID=A0A2T8KPN4_9POAL|nr:hypothetical protein PAHAL_2G189600 [Panicum hallii]
MENLEDSEHHGTEEVIYESDEVYVVLDTFAGETQVPDSLSAADVETVAVAESEVDVAHALMLLAKTKVNTFQADKFQADKEARYVANLMIPLLVPCLYREDDEDVKDAATDLHWISHGYGHGFGAPEVADEE